MAFNIKWEEKGFLGVFWGDVPFDEIDTANKMFYNDERSDRSKYQIFDFTKVDNVSLTAEEIMYIAALDTGASKSIKNMRVAVVAKDEDMKRQYDEYVQLSKKINSNWAFGAFEDMDSAREWVMPYNK